MRCAASGLRLLHRPPQAPNPGWRAQPALVSRDRLCRAANGRRLRLRSERSQRRHRCGNAAFLMRNAGELEAHLDSGERAEEGEVVEIAEMADAKHLVGELAEA